MVPGAYAYSPAAMKCRTIRAPGLSVDNALAESFNATLQRVVLAGVPDQATAYRAVFRWAVRYNTRRRHSAIGSMSPNSYETTVSATVARAA